MCGNFKVSTIILIMFSVITLLAIAAVMTTYAIHIQYISDIWVNSSLEMIRKENDNLLSRQQLLFEQRLNTILYQIENKQTIVKQVHNFVQINDPVTQKPIICPVNITQIDSISVFCMIITGQSYNNTNLDKLQLESKLISIMQQILLIFDNSQFIATGQAFTTNNTVLGTWPALNYSSIYNPHVRIWYLNHIKNMVTGQKFLYSDLFTTIIDSYTIAITSNLTDINGYFNGVVFNLLDFGVLKKNFNKNYVLVNLQGQIIISNFKYPSTTTKPMYIFNSTITGFSDDDWIQIQAFSFNGKGQSNCQQQIGSKFLCRYNNQYNQDILMIIKYLGQPAYHMIILQNVTSIYQSIGQIQDQIQVELTHQIMITLCTIFGSSIILYFIFVIKLRYITRPFKMLINLTKMNLQIEKKQMNTRSRSNTIVNRLKELDVGQSETSELILSYFSLVQRLDERRQKNELCKTIESLEYPTSRRKKLRIDNSYLRDFTDQNTTFRFL